MAPIPTPRLPLWLRALHSSTRYTATASVRGLLVAESRCLFPIGSIHPSIASDVVVLLLLLLFFLLLLLWGINEID